jgi:hypothetical protein
MVKRFRVTKRFPVLVGFVVVAGGCVAQTSSGTPLPASSRFGDLSFTVAQKIWFATWDTTLQDVRVVIPPGTAVPVAEVAFLPGRAVSKAIPITTFALSSGPFVLSASVSPSTEFSHPLAPDGSISRREYDVNFGYAISPNVVAAAIYKAGKISDTTTTALTNRVGFRSELKLSGWGAGLSANAPIAFGTPDDPAASPLRVYGNIAYILGDSKVQGVKTDTEYKIAEIGLSYRIGSAGPISSVAVQLGYRSQIVTQKDIDVPTFSVVSPGTVLSTQRVKLRTTTDGFVIGLVGSF